MPENHFKIYLSKCIPNAFAVVSDIIFPKRNITKLFFFENYFILYLFDNLLKNIKNS